MVPKIVLAVFLIVCGFLGVLLPMWACVALGVGGWTVFATLKDRETNSKALNMVTVIAFVIMVVGGIATVFKFIGEDGGSCGIDTNGRVSWSEC